MLSTLLVLTASWAIAGRMLRPVQTLTATTRQFCDVSRGNSTHSRRHLER